MRALGYFTCWAAVKGSKDLLHAARAALGVDGDEAWPAAERSAFASLALAVALIDDLGHWRAEDKAACVALMRAKGADDDRDFFRGLATHPRLPAALAAIARSGG